LIDKAIPVLLQFLNYREITLKIVHDWRKIEASPTFLVTKTNFSIYLMHNWLWI